MEILGRWLAAVVLAIALASFLLSLLRAKDPFAEAFESAVAIAGARAAPQPRRLRCRGSPRPRGRGAGGRAAGAGDGGSAWRRAPSVVLSRARGPC
jgi:hypothetical protein